ncbi:MAG TPA: MOSC domain-containing protein [Blastocatellia bacterium]|nr:MOSC domain-containing protein [Blastocatellia bacterium]
MSLIGNVESLWRYPVKSMRGEELEEAFVGFAGVYGDRVFAFKSSASHKGFPYLTAREQQHMLKYQPRFRNPVETAQPPNLSEAESLAPGATPLYADADDWIVDVETPSGEILSIDDAGLIRMLGEGIRDAHNLTLLRSERALTDCRPVSLFSLQTVRQIGEEVGVETDKRRFRANVYVDLASAAGFGEDALVGRSLRLGSKAIVSILERDPRCKMITLDPDTGEANPEFSRKVAEAHDGKAGVYAAVLVEGRVRRGDPIELLE